MNSDWILKLIIKEKCAKKNDMAGASQCALAMPATLVEYNLEF